MYRRVTVSLRCYMIVANVPDTVYRIHNGVSGEEKRSLLQPVQEKELFQSSQWRNRLCDNFPFGFLETFSYIQEAVEAYCRKERLDFKEDGGVRAMTRLTEYIDSLIHGK